MMGEAIYKEGKVSGSSYTSFLEWRVKRSLDEEELFIGLSMESDGYIRMNGGPSTHYINFTLDQAIRLRSKLDQCIDYAQRQTPSRNVSEHGQGE